MKQAHVISKGIQTLIFCSASLSTGGLVLSLIGPDTPDPGPKQPSKDAKQPALALETPDSADEKRTNAKVADPELVPTLDFSPDRPALVPMTTLAKDIVPPGFKDDLLRTSVQLEAAPLPAAAATGEPQFSSEVREEKTAENQGSLLQKKGVRATVNLTPSASQPQASPQPLLSLEPVSTRLTVLANDSPQATSPLASNAESAASQSVQPDSSGFSNGSVAKPETMAASRSLPKSHNTSLQTDLASSLTPTLVKEPALQESELDEPSPTSTLNTVTLAKVRKLPIVPVQKMPTIVITALPPDVVEPVEGSASLPLANQVGVPELLREQRFPNEALQHDR